MEYIFLLDGTNRKSKGEAKQVSKNLRQFPEKFLELLECFNHPNQVIHIRAAHVIQMLASQIPMTIERYQKVITDIYKKTEVPEVKWILAQMLNQFTFTKAQQKGIKHILENDLNAPHKFLVAHTIEALANHLIKYHYNLTNFKSKLVQLTATGSPAIQARGRKILKKLDR